MGGHQMVSARRGVGSRPMVMATSLALVTAILTQLPAASQSPSAAGSSAAPGASTGPATSPVPVDVGAIRWKGSDPPKGFDPDPGKGTSPMAFDLGVGADGRFLLAGVVNQGFTPLRAVVWGSDDGGTWKALKGKVPDGSQAAAVLATEDGFLIAGDVNGSAPLLLSSDGTRLAPLDAPAEGLPTGRLFGLERTPLGLVAPGADAAGASTVWISADGISWTGAPIPEAAYVIHAAVADDGTLVVLGQQQDADGNRAPTIWTSTDGVAWTARPFPVEPGDWSVPDLERTPVGLIATLKGQDASSAWLSTDGVSWTQVLEAPSRIIVGTAGTEAILLGTNAWWHSADGVTWDEAAARAFKDHTVETSAVRPDGAVIAAGYESFGVQGSAVRTWIGRVPVP